MKWIMISLVFLATVINYLDRQTLSVVAPQLMDEFNMNSVAYSRVVTAFMLAYTIMNGIAGPMIDRVGTRIGYAICIAWWSAAAMLHALARGPVSLGVFRFLLGMGEAGNWPAGVKVVSEWFPAEQRALASGIFNSGSSIGALIAAPLVAWIVINYGWAFSFASVGAIGFVWLIAWLSIYRTPEKFKKETAAPPVPALTLLRDPWVINFFLAKIFIDPTWYFYVFWFPNYLNKARGFTLADIGKFGWIPFLTADLGNLIGGWLSGYLIRRGMNVTRARKVCIVFFCAIMTSAVPAVLVENAYVSIAFISIATLGYTGTLANMLAMPIDSYPKNALASIWGLASMGSGLGGMIFSLATGWLIDNYSWHPVFFGFAVLPLCAAYFLYTLPARAPVESLQAV